MYKYYLQALQSHLKRKIKGEVKCHIIADTLVIDIYGVNEIVFKYCRKYITSDIVQGFPSEIVANIVINAYRKYVNNLYFM